MEILQLKYFKAVAEMGKISDAAESLFISPPALSASIARLEKDLGMRLFDRTNNRIVLNQQGKIFLQGVNRVFATLENTCEEMRRSLSQQTEQSLSLCLISSTQWVELVTSYAQSYPEVRLSCVDMSSGNLELSGFPAQHDFLLADREDVPAGLREELELLQLWEDHPVIMVNSRHPLAHRDAIEVEELHNEVLFLPMRTYPVSRYLKGMFSKAGIPFPAENTLSYLTAQNMAAKGLGIGFSSVHTVRNACPELRYVPISTPHEPWRLGLYWRKGGLLSPQAQSFLEFVRNYCKEQHQDNVDIMQG